MHLWDTHCHIFKEYYEDLDFVFDESKDVGVTNFILSGCDTLSNQEVLKNIEIYENCYGVIGIHPEFADVYKKEDIEYLLNHLSNSKIIGIGEIGLDYHYTKDNKDAQKALFEQQLKLAEQFHLPVVIHSREATEDTIAILKKYKVKGIIHSFSGSLEVAQIYIKMGFKLGINGVITFKNSKLKDILPAIFPFIVLETDSPYLTPHPFRGMQNSPKYVRNIAEFIAQYQKISISQVEKVTISNVYSIFDKLPII